MNSVGILRGGILGEATRGKHRRSKAQSREHGSEALRKHPASEIEIHIPVPFELDS
jgi:hypothetical protein